MKNSSTEKYIEAVKRNFKAIEEVEVKNYTWIRNEVNESNLAQGLN